jgi:DNA-directed RNA polymerase sigma subunit (sigma70/sigma32)
MKRTTAVKASVFPRRLSGSDEVRLAKRIKHGDLEAKEQMIESKLVLVHAVASEYRGRGVQFDDLVQEEPLDWFVPWTGSIRGAA